MKNKINKFKTLFILGPPGSGKGTQCHLLVNKLNTLHLSAGELLRREVKKKLNYQIIKKTDTSVLIEKYIKEGKIVPVEITCSLLRNEMEENKNIVILFIIILQYDLFLIDGFPRNFNNLNGWLKQMKDVVDLRATILINCDKVKNYLLIRKQ